MNMDISSLPISAKYGQPGREINLADVAGKVYGLIPTMVKSGLLSTGPGGDYSFGFAMAVIDHNQRISAWDDYQKLTLFVAGFGENSEAYIANAVRKMRYSARTGKNSLTAAGSDGPTWRVQDPAEMINPDGSLPWGDFPHGGAVFLETPIVNGFKPGPAWANTRWLLAAVSGFTQEEDAAIAASILQFINLAIEKADAPQS